MNETVEILVKFTPDVRLGRLVQSEFPSGFIQITENNEIVFSAHSNSLQAQDMQAVIGKTITNTIYARNIEREYENQNRK